MDETSDKEPTREFREVLKVWIGPVSLSGYLDIILFL